MIAERACLRGTAAGARNSVPRGWNRLAWRSGARVAEDNGQTGEAGEVHGPARGGLEGEGGWDGVVFEMVRSAVIFWYWKCIWLCEICAPKSSAR